MKRLLILLGVLLFFFLLLWKWPKTTGFLGQVGHTNESRTENMKKNGSEEDNMIEKISESKAEALPYYASLEERIGYKNETSYEELITTKYPVEELEWLEGAIQDFKLNLRTMEEFYDMVNTGIDARYKLECVRETDRGAYVLFLGEDGSLLWAFFDKETYYIRQVETFRRFLSIKDFEFIESGITRKSEIEDIYGKLHTHRERASAYRLYNCIVKEGTLLIYFHTSGPNWTRQDTANPPVQQIIFMPDGEKAEESFEQVPEMLPMDKYIVEN